MAYRMEEQKEKKPKIPRQLNPNATGGTFSSKPKRFNETNPTVVDKVAPVTFCFLVSLAFSCMYHIHGVGWCVL